MDGIGDKYPYGQGRRQLYDGFESNGCHQSFVPFGCIQVTGTEQNRKYRQQQGDIKRGVAQYRQLGITDGYVRIVVDQQKSG